MLAVIIITVWVLMNISKYRDLTWYYSWKEYLVSYGKVGLEEIPITLFYLPCVIAKSREKD